MEFTHPTRYTPDRAWNVTEHPTADWTVQQFRAVVPGDQPQRFLIHNRYSICAAPVDRAVAAMGLTVLKTPVRCPQANAYGERADRHDPSRVFRLADCSE
jgi:hypothetical protein